MAQASVKRNYIYNVSYQILVLITPLVTTPYISRVLGAENIGIYSYTFSIVTYFTLFLVLGLHMYGQREIAYAQNDIHRQTVIFVNVQLYKLITTVICSTVYLLFLYLNNQYFDIMIVQGIGIIAAFFDISWYFTGLEQFRLMVTRNALVKLAGIAAVFIFVKTSDDLLLYAFLIAMVNLLGNLLLWGFTFGRFDKLKKNEIHIFRDNKTILELFIPLIAVQVYNVLDKTMLGSSMGDMVECGYYEQTTKIINLCMTIITSFGTVLAPHMAAEFVKSNYSSVKKEVNDAFSFIGLIMFPIFFGVVSVADSMVPWFFGNGYEKVSLIIKLYAIVLLIIPLSNIAASAVLIPSKQHNKSTLAVVIGAVVNLMLNLILIPKLLSVGAAIATIAAEFIVTFVHIIFIREYVDFKIVLMKYAQYLTAAVFMGLLSYGIGRGLMMIGLQGFFVTFIQIISGAMIYGGVVVFVIKDNYIVGNIKKLTDKMFN